MKLIGLIGGASYQSSIEYYRIINDRTNAILGRQHSARISMVSLDFEEIVAAFYSDRWDDIAKIMINAARQLERSGVDFIAICCNTLHKVAAFVERSVAIPFLHILEPTGQKIKEQKIDKVGLLGSKFTMSGTFHKDYLSNRFQITSIAPEEKEKEIINNIIFEELCYGFIREESKQAVLEVINSLERRGAQGIILGCTELPLLLPSGPNLNIPVFNTTSLHAEAIVKCALTSNFTEQAHFKQLAACAY